MISNSNLRVAFGFYLTEKKNEELEKLDPHSLIFTFVG